MYLDLAVDETTFYRKTAQQKQAVLKKFNQQKVRAEDIASTSANDEPPPTVAPLSKSPQQSGIIHVSYSLLNAMFSKAGSLHFRGQQAIVGAP